MEAILRESYEEVECICESVTPACVFGTLCGCFFPEFVFHYASVFVLTLIKDIV